MNLFGFGRCFEVHLTMSYFGMVGNINWLLFRLNHRMILIFVLISKYLWYMFFLYWKMIFFFELVWNFFDRLFRLSDRMNHLILSTQSVIAFAMWLIVYLKINFDCFLEFFFYINNTPFKHIHPIIRITKDIINVSDEDIGNSNCFWSICDVCHWRFLRTH